jgi:hypothetical protein
MDKDLTKQNIPTGRVFSDTVTEFSCKCGSATEAATSECTRNGKALRFDCECCGKPMKATRSSRTRWFKHVAATVYGPVTYGPFRSQAGAELASDDNARD